MIEWSYCDYDRKLQLCNFYSTCHWFQLFLTTFLIFQSHSILASTHLTQFLYLFITYTVAMLHYFYTDCCHIQLLFDLDSNSIPKIQIAMFICLLQAAEINKLLIIHTFRRISRKTVLFSPSVACTINVWDRKSRL